MKVQARDPVDALNKALGLPVSGAHKPDAKGEAATHPAPAPAEPKAAAPAAAPRPKPQAEAAPGGQFLAPPVTAPRPRGAPSETSPPPAPAGAQPGAAEPGAVSQEEPPSETPKGSVPYARFREVNDQLKTMRGVLELVGKRMQEDAAKRPAPALHVPIGEETPPKPIDQMTFEERAEWNTTQRVRKVAAETAAQIIEQQVVPHVGNLYLMRREGEWSEIQRQHPGIDRETYEDEVNEYLQANRSSTLADAVTVIAGRHGRLNDLVNGSPRAPSPPPTAAPGGSARPSAGVPAPPGPTGEQRMHSSFQNAVVLSRRGDRKASEKALLEGFKHLLSGRK